MGAVKISAKKNMSSANHPVELLQIDDPQWVHFLNHNGQATIFHHPAWSQLSASCYGYNPFVVVLKNETGRIQAGVPFMEVKSPISSRRKWVSLPFSDYCYPMFSNDVPQAFVEDVVLLSQSKGVSLVEFRSEVENSSSLYGHSNHVIHKAVLEPDFDKVKGRMHEMHRRNVNVARKSGVQIVFGSTDEHMLEFYNLHLHTRRDQGVPIQPLNFFKKLKTTVLDQGLGFILLAYKDDQCLAGAVFLHWHKTLTYKFGASSEAGLNLRPNNLIMWTAMQWGCDHGFTCFDFGRTDLENTGLRTFKSRWGAKEEPLYYYSTVPSKSQKASTGKLEQIVHFVIRNSPLWVCRLSGELLYRYFG
jgi:CelD/BcsL family acetyltransferase involved in cellulose biosynthesis